jgi:hypothetical protein
VASSPARGPPRASVARMNTTSGPGAIMAVNTVATWKASRWKFTLPISSLQVMTRQAAGCAPCYGSGTSRNAIAPPRSANWSGSKKSGSDSATARHHGGPITVQKGGPIMLANSSQDGLCPGE